MPSTPADTDPGAQAPPVSVVMPAGAVDDLLLTQLEALRTQSTDRAYEIVISFNGADPGDLERLRRTVTALGDPRVRVVAATDRRGASYARNVGAAAARGEVLAFCDSDDICEATWLDRLLAALDQHGAVGGHLRDFGLPDDQLRARPPATPDALPTYLGSPYIVSANLGVRRADFVDAGGFDEQLVRCEDIALSWALAHRGVSLGYAADAVVAYRHRAGLRRMLRQHYLYGIGMSQLLVRYGLPDGDRWDVARGRGLLRANAQPGSGRTPGSTLRRGAIAAGRLVGLLRERAWRRPNSRPPLLVDR